MSTDEVVVPAQAQTPNKKQDDFDMAKLKKSLRQDQKRSSVSKHKVAKLTPAEIRSLNHGVGVSKSKSHHGSDHRNLRGLASNTPPLTPDNHSSSRRHASHTSRRASNDLPTPPLSPARERRASTSSTNHIHAPKPISHIQTKNIVNAVPTSRPPSATSYRGIETYRGPEITRTGSLTMLQRPSQQIVSNPLSQFSRPRQSTLTASPQKPSSERRGSDDIVSPIPVKARQQSIGAISQNPSRDHSPVRKSDSPVSVEEAKAPVEPVFISDGPGFVPVIHVTPRISVDDSHVKSPDSSDAPAQQKQERRKSSTGLADPNQDPTPLRKEYRRRTLMSPKHGYCLHAIHYADTKPGVPPQMRDSLKDELPSAKTSIFKDDPANATATNPDSEQHPAVRPLAFAADTENVGFSETNSSPGSSRKGKERETDPNLDGEFDSISMTSSTPSYSRCSCCGRIQKPGGFESDLSPVLENEYLRTNMGFEVEKTMPNHRRRSSSLSSGPRKYVPIIPMEVGNETKQARIEPYEVKPVNADPAPAVRGVAVNKPGDVIGPSSMPLAIMPKPKGAPRFTRFGSLHAKREDLPDNINPPEQKQQYLTPTHQIQRFGSLYGLRNEYLEQAQNSDVGNGQSQPQSAYQAQQARQALQAADHRPVRSSRLAYQESPPPEEERDPGQQDTIETPPDALERPLVNTFVVSQDVPFRFSEEYSPVMDDDEMMVDLSSFDGHFVHKSISRSVSVVHHSPPATRDGANNTTVLPDSFPTTSSNSLSTTSSSEPLSSETAQPQQPSKIITNLPSFHNETTVNATAISTAISDPNPLSAVLAERSSQPNNLLSAVSNPATPIDTKLVNATAAAMYRPAATKIRIIPSPTISTHSSQKSGQGPLRLGDWVLPETPSTATANG